VASEVRALAQRSAEAAREIKALIGNSVQKVAAGTSQVEDAGRTMAEIVTSVEKVAAHIGQISSASHEQAAGIEQVNGAIGQMEHAVQRNAAMVAQAAAAAEAMQGSAQRLVQSVSVFKLGAGEAVPAAQPPRPAGAPRLAVVRGATRLPLAAARGSVNR
jgi:methyl-accepting chemotaxis protein